MGSIALTLIGLGLMVVVMAGLFYFGGLFALVGGASFAVLAFRLYQPAFFWGTILGNGLGTAVMASTLYRVGEPSIPEMLLPAAFLLNLAAIWALRRTRRA